MRATGPQDTADRRTPRKRIRVLVADGDRLARIGLVCLLRELAGVEVAGDFDQALADGDLDRMVAEQRADVVIRRFSPAELAGSAADPAGDGRGATIVLSDTATPEDVQSAFAAGARAFLVDARAPEHLDAALQAVTCGRRFLDPELGARFAAEAVHGHLAGAGALTPRERQVLSLLAAGRTNGEIATELGISPRTVEGHRTRIGRKLGLHRRAELVEYALLHRLRTAAVEEAASPGLPA